MPTNLEEELSEFLNEAQTKRVRKVVYSCLAPPLTTILKSLQKYIEANRDGTVGEHPNKTFLRTEKMVEDLLESLVVGKDGDELEDPSCDAVKLHLIKNCKTCKEQWGGICPRKL